MTKHTHKNIISLTDGELAIVIEAVGYHRRVLKSKQAKMMNKYGFSDTSKSRKRLEFSRTATKKLTKKPLN